MLSVAPEGRSRSTRPPVRDEARSFSSLSGLSRDALFCTASSMHALRLASALLLAVFIGTACGRAQDSADPAVPSDLRQTLEQLADGLEAFDPEQVLPVYADDFISGTGRSKRGVGEVLIRLRQSKVSLNVEQVDVTQADDTRAAITTSMRLRYTDRFRNIGTGEVVITDVLSHLLRKDAGQWRIYTDKRLAAYREGRFGAASPNVTVEVPARLPTGLDYPVAVVVQQQPRTRYRVAIGNYPEDPGVLPPPDVEALLPRDGRLETNLLPNPQGVSEMVRVTVIAADVRGDWQGATTVSKLVPGVQRTERRKRQVAPPLPSDQQDV